jgi:hypothetical protein
VVQQHAARRLDAHRHELRVQRPPAPAHQPTPGPPPRPTPFCPLRSNGRRRTHPRVVADRVRDDLLEIAPLRGQPTCDHPARRQLSPPRARGTVEKRSFAVATVVASPMSAQRQRGPSWETWGVSEEGREMRVKACSKWRAATLSENSCPGVSILNFVIRTGVA